MVSGVWKYGLLNNSTSAQLLHIAYIIYIEQYRAGKELRSIKNPCVDFGFSCKRKLQIFHNQC